MSRIVMVRIVRGLTILVLGCVIVGVGLNATGLFAADRSDGMRLHQLAAQLPLLFYLAAIWMIQRAHAALAGGETLEVTLSTLLRRLGVCLFLGGIARVFGELGLVKLVLGEPGPWAWFDVAAITIGCVGLLLFLLAVPLREAAKARAELADIL